MIECEGCHQIKPEAEYYKTTSKLGHTRKCKVCRCAEMEEAHKMRVYGLEKGQWDKMLSQQDHKCLLCDKPFDKTVPKLRACLDHCHKTGKVRGIIHLACNTAIGLLGDDPVLILAAYEYLKKYG